MEREWLEAQLAAGRSIESLARELGRAASTVAYWMNKHGLVSSHAARHAPRGGIERDTLAPLVEQGMSLRQIAATLDVSATTVRHWLARHGLRTQPAHYRRPDDDKPFVLLRECRRHGWTGFVAGGNGLYRCRRCNAEAVSTRRRRLKAQLVREAGGACVLCGYARYLGALQFHHRDPTTKRFSLAGGGIARSLERAREEAAKCVLLCANCHAEVEGGVATIAPARPADNL
ncbi:MAG TPA: helix-turn-helix domain-containing protein [Solirubrobacteraceae bacterium]|nr:helix-turn-helix domain-containing protein [Solirubrobacteraceae bacterium]